MRCTADKAVKPGEQGFTLVELLIAISLLGLISVVTYGAIWTANRSLHAVERRVELSDELRITQEFFRQSLSQARGVMAVRDGRMAVVFNGEAESLSFVAPAPLQRGSAGGLYRYRFKLGGDADTGRTLYLSYAQFLAGLEYDDLAGLQGKSLLMAGVKEISFSYYGSAVAGDEARWLDEWPRRDMLPQLVQLKLKREEGGENTILTVEIKGQVG